MKKSIRTLVMFLAVAFGVLAAAGVTSKAATAEITNLKQTEATESSVKLTWDAVPGAVRYQVFMSVSEKGDYVPQGSDSSNPKAEISRLSAGSTYWVYVEAYDDWLSDSEENTIASCKPIAISTLSALPEMGKVEGLVQTAATSNSVSMKWNAVPNTTIYKIYRYDAWDNTPEVGSTTSTEFTVTGLAASNAYRYFVIAYYVDSATGRTAYNRYYDSLAMKTVPNKVLTVAMTNYYDSIHVAYYDWTSVPNADGYQFQLVNNKGKSLFKTEWSGTGVKVSPFKEGVFTKARVRAYINVNGTKVYGPWSSYNYNAANKKITVRRSSNRKKITIKWKKISGAAGYNLYISTKSGSGYKKVKSLSSKKTKYTITKCGKKKLKKGKKYYIRLEYLTKSGKKKVKSQIMGSGNIVL